MKNSSWCNIYCPNMRLKCSQLTLWYLLYSPSSHLLQHLRSTFIDNWSIALMSGDSLSYTIIFSIFVRGIYIKSKASNRRKALYINIYLYLGFSRSLSLYIPLGQVEKAMFDVHGSIKSDRHFHVARDLFLCMQNMFKFYILSKYAFFNL